MDGRMGIQRDSSGGSNEEEFGSDLRGLQIQVDNAWEPPDLRLTKLSPNVEPLTPPSAAASTKPRNGDNGDHAHDNFGISPVSAPAPRRASKEMNWPSQGGSFGSRRNPGRSTSVADQLDSLIHTTIDKVDSQTPDHTHKSSFRRKKTSTTEDSRSSGSEDGEPAIVSAELGLSTPMRQRSAAESSTGGKSNEKNAKALWAKATWYATQQAADSARSRGSMRVTSSEGVARLASAPASGGSFLRHHGGMDEESRCYPVQRFLESVPMLCFFFATTVYALFFHDIYFLSRASPDGDYPLFSCTFAVACVFVLELLVRSLAEKDYFLGYIFWLDLVAIISFVPDIAWWANKTDLIGLLGNLTIARAGRAARAGARAARIVRAMGYIRRYLQRNQEDDDEEHETVHDFGKNLGAKISQLLIIVVAAMLVLGAVTEGISGVEPRVDWELKAVANAYVDGFGKEAGSPEFATFVQHWVEDKADSREPALLVEVDGVVVWGSEAEVAAVRQFPAEFHEAEVEEFREGMGRCRLVSSRRDEAEREYIGSIVTAFVIIVLLSLCSCYFSGYLDAELVLPMERMMASVEAFARDPLRPLKERSSLRHKETIDLENALIKFGCLLQIAYGEAGAKVISASLHNDSTAQVGKIVNAFFGFCDIRNFTDLTEVLQAEVVKMVNDVAHVVHEAVCLNHGAPNKNIGDAFLLVWKPKKRETSASQTAESALRSYIAIIIELTRNKELKAFASRKEIQDRIPNFSVRLGFGLHFGWAIECAIGSQRKIDASYLSPHVNMASRLESATKMFGVAILISEATYQLFSSSVQKMCRLIDRVTFKGSVRPMSIYTYDVPYIQVGGNGGTLNEDVCLDDDDMDHEDFFELAKPHTSEQYRANFEAAVHLYLGKPNGHGANWTEAKAMLREALDKWPEDGAARKLLDHLEEAGDKDRPDGVPEGWQGYRKLDEK